MASLRRGGRMVAKLNVVTENQVHDPVKGYKCALEKLPFVKRNTHTVGRHMNDNEGKDVHQGSRCEEGECDTCGPPTENGIMDHDGARGARGGRGGQWRILHSGVDCRSSGEPCGGCRRGERRRGGGRFHDKGIECSASGSEKHGGGCRGFGHVGFWTWVLDTSGLGTGFILPPWAFRLGAQNAMVWVGFQYPPTGFSRGPELTQPGPRGPLWAAQSCSFLVQVFRSRSGSVEPHYLPNFLYFSLLFEKFTFKPPNEVFSFWIFCSALQVMMPRLHCSASQPVTTRC